MKTTYFTIYFLISLSLQEEPFESSNCVNNDRKVEDGRVCQKKCSNHADCDVLTSCYCDDWCGPSCVNLKRPCDSLTSPRNGRLLTNGRTYGDVVIYNCNTGYILTGLHYRKCRSDGKWSGLAPKCLPYNSCGQSNKRSASSIHKVVRGEKASHAAWPWQAMLVYNKDMRVHQSLQALLGGATIINSNWVLSSAHLFDNFPSNDPLDWRSRILVVAGISDVPDSHEAIRPEVQIYQPQAILRHRSYNKINLDYDASLIHIGARLIPGRLGIFINADTVFAGSFSFTDFVRPVCLPCTEGRLVNETNSKELQHSLHQGPCELHNDTKLQSDAIVIGFGERTPKSETDLFLKRSKELRQGVMNILPRELCVEGVERIKRTWANAEFTSRMICARGNDSSNLIDACIGDSGGPLLQKVSIHAGSNYWTQVGIVSWGWGCANTDDDGYTYPGYYTDVKSIVNWISNTLKTYSDSREEENFSKSGATDTVDAVVIIGFSGKFKTFSFSPHKTIDFIKETFQTLFGFRPEDQVIFYKDRKLSGSKTLNYYHFQSGDYLFLYVVFYSSIRIR